MSVSSISIVVLKEIFNVGINHYGGCGIEIPDLMNFNKFMILVEYLSNLN